MPNPLERGMEGSDPTSRYLLGSNDSFDLKGIIPPDSPDLVYPMQFT